MMRVRYDQDFLSHFLKLNFYVFYRALALEEVERRGRWLLASLKDTGDPAYANAYDVYMQNLCIANYSKIKVTPDIDHV